MRIHSESLIRYPVHEVFLAYRDRLPEIARYIDDIKEIVVESRQEQGDVVKLHNVWIADREVPAFARAVLKPEMLRWDDFAEWRMADYRCAWEIKPRAFTDSVQCKGTNTLIKVDENTTRVVLEGELKIDLKGIPGVPRMLAGRMAPKVEQFIVSLITPNLIKTNESIGKYLNDA